MNRLHRLLIASNGKSSKNKMIFWFSLSMTFAVIYAILGLQQAFSSEYVVQDDARQHVFWMLRFLDKNLFPNDLIADYFQSVAPVGYSSLYHLLATLGVDPLLFNKLLPSILGLLTTAYCFGTCLQILPIPFAGFMATLMLNQNLWMREDLVSGTPRAFVYLFFLAFLYYLSRQSLLFCLATIVLLGVFYPQCVFICVGILILRMWDWQTGSFRFSHQQHDYLFCAVGLIVAFLVMLPYALKSSEFAPVITLAQAKRLPELFSGGRSVFFNDNLFYYFLGGRSGMFTKFSWSPVTICTGFFLPLLWQFRHKFSLFGQLTSEIMLLPQILLVSLVMFVSAHILLFKLYLPSRYTQYSLIIILVLSAAIALTTILDTVLSNSYTKGKKYSLLHQFFALGFTVLLAITLLFYYPCFVKKFPKSAYKTGNVPQLYEFFQKQPKHTLITSLAGEIDNLPTFSQRSILAGREYAIPWHFGYYNKFRQRTMELFQAHYSPNLEDVKNLINKYGVDFWMLESGAFTPEYIKNNTWLKGYFFSQLTEDKLVKLTTNIFQRLQQGIIPALSKVVPNCTVAKIQGFVVLDAKCIASVHSTDSIGNNN